MEKLAMVRPSDLKSLLSADIDSQSIQRLLGTFIALIAFYHISAVVYNIYVSPLRKFPGPKLAAVSYYPYRYRKFNGNLLPWYIDLHKQYGPIVRITPGDLSFVDENAIRDVYGSRKANPKPASFYNLPFGKANDLVHELDDSRHSQMRKIFSGAFSERALKLQEPLILGYVDKLIQNMKIAITEQPTKVLSLVKLYNFTTFDVMGDLAFGEPLGMLEDREYTPWVKAVFSGLTVMQQIKSLPIQILGLFLLPKGFLKIMTEHFDKSCEQVNRRLEGDRESFDIWKLALEKGRDKNLLSLDEMHINAALFMIAGTETSATALSGATYLLLKNPSKLQKLVEEIRSQPNEEGLNLENLARLPYLNACLEEALRCYPPVAEGLPRVTPKDGNTICGQYIPPNTTLWVPHFVLYHSEKLFKDPYEYVPERWLGDEEYKSDKRHAVQPFVLGPRNCLGQSLAYHEMRVILAKVLWNFDLRLSPLSENWSDQKSYLLWAKPDLFVTAKLARARA